jgi:hypothetical protein
MKKLIIAAVLAFAIPVLATVTSTSTRIDYTGNGATTVFAFSFPTQKTADIEVFVGGVKLTSGFAVSLNANQGVNPGGSVTITPAPDLTLAVRVQRTVALKQETVWKPYDPFPAKVTESAHDRQMMAVQQLDRRVSDSESVNAAQDAQIGALAVGSPVNAGAALVTASGGTTPRSLAARALDLGVNVLDKGADPTGVVPSTAAFQAAIDYAVSSGKRKVYAPPGKYLVGSLNFHSHPYGIYGLDFGGGGSGWQGNPVTEIVATEANRALFDCTAADALTFHDFIVTSGGSAAAGFLFSRTHYPAGYPTGGDVSRWPSAGTHTMRNVRIHGSWTKAAVVSLSSEGNKYYDVVFENTATNGIAFISDIGNEGIGMVSNWAILGSDETIPNIQSGGTTMGLFSGCSFLAMGGGNSKAVKGVFVDVTMENCYTNSTGLAVFDLETHATTTPSGGWSGVKISGHRDESNARYGFYLAPSGAEVYASVIAGGHFPAFYGVDGTTVRDSQFVGYFTWNNIGTPPGQWAFNLATVSNSTFLFTSGGNFQARTSAQSNRIMWVGGPGAGGGSVTLPTDQGGNYVQTSEATGGVGNGYDATTPIKRVAVADGAKFDLLTTQRLRAKKVQTVVQEITASTVNNGALYHLVPDASAGSVWSVTLDHDLTIDAPVFAAASGLGGDGGARMTFIFKQDGTGGRTVNWNSTYYQPRGTTANVSPGGFQLNLLANSTSVVTFVGDTKSQRWVVESMSTTPVYQYLPTHPGSGGTLTIDPVAGERQVVVIGGGQQGYSFTIAAPTNGTPGQRVSITIYNASGAAFTGTITWTGFKMAGGTAPTNPANGTNRTIEFQTAGGSNPWFEVFRVGGDVSNS